MLITSEISIAFETLITIIMLTTCERPMISETMAFIEEVGSQTGMKLITMSMITDHGLLLTTVGREIMIQIPDIQQATTQIMSGEDTAKNTGTGMVIGKNTEVEKEIGALTETNTGIALALTLTLTLTLTLALAHGLALALALAAMTNGAGGHILRKGLILLGHSLPEGLVLHGDLILLSGLGLLGVTAEVGEKTVLMIPIMSRHGDVIEMKDVTTSALVWLLLQHLW